MTSIDPVGTTAESYAPRTIEKASVERKLDLAFKWFTGASAWLIVALMAAIFLSLLHFSYPAVKHFGLAFLTSTTWDPVKQDFGAATSIFGTLVSTAIAVVIAVPLALAIALFLVELSHPAVSRVVGAAIELLAAIPSIIFGMWGLFVFAPFMANYIQPALKSTLGWLPLFRGPSMGIGMLTAGLILALMILPYITAVTRDVLYMVPSVIKESAAGVGSTKWETTWHVSLRYGLRGIVGAVFLGLGRAIGETMAVTFVIGNDHKISGSLFAAGNTIASTIANEFSEASEPLYQQALIELGLVLFLLTTLFQVAAWLWLKRVNVRTEAL